MVMKTFENVFVLAKMIFTSVSDFLLVYRFYFELTCIILTESEEILLEKHTFPVSHVI